MSIRKLLVSICLLALPLTSQAASTITVAVAANLQVAFADLSREFTNETGIKVNSAFSSSGKLTTQIENGAPFDVFLSADMGFPQRLADKNLTVDVPKTYAYGTLILWSKRNVDLTNWQKTLSSDAIKKIAIANPKTAPYGREAKRALDYFHLQPVLESKLVYAESVGQVNQYIDSKVVDVGFTAKSIIFSPKIKEKGKWIDVPKNAYQPIAQGIVLLKSSKEQAAGKRFIDFILSDKARAIFARYGYLSK